MNLGWELYYTYPSGFYLPPNAAYVIQDTRASGGSHDDLLCACEEER